MSTSYISFPPEGVPTYATAANLPVPAGHGDLGVVLDTNTLYEFNGTSWIILGSSGAATAIDGLTGDVSASGPGVVAATVNSVGGSSAANIHSAELAANAATAANTVSTIVKRDSSGNFAAGTITASLTGDASLDLPLSGARPMTGALDMGTHLIHNVVNPVSAQDAATKSYVDAGSGLNQLTGDVTAGPGTGSQAATVAFVGGATAANVATATAEVLAATALATANTLMLRDADADVQVHGIGRKTVASTIIVDDAGGELVLTPTNPDVTVAWADSGADSPHQADVTVVGNAISLAIDGVDNGGNGSTSLTDIANAINLDGSASLLATASVNSDASNLNDIPPTGLIITYDNPASFGLFNDFLIIGAPFVASNNSPFSGGLLINTSSMYSGLQVQQGGSPAQMLSIGTNGASRPFIPCLIQELVGTGEGIWGVGNNAAGGFMLQVGTGVNSPEGPNRYTFQQNGQSFNFLTLDYSSKGTIISDQSVLAADTMPSGVSLWHKSSKDLLSGGKVLATGGLGVGNSAAASTPGTVVNKMEVFDASGASLGFIAIYDAIT